MNHFICTACGHNGSQHRREWNKFRGVWVTSCRADDLGRSGREYCRCPEFRAEAA